MSPGRWRRVNEIFHAARELSTSDAGEFVRSECGDDAELCELVLRMLAENERTGTMDHPIVRFPQNSGGVFAAGEVVAGRYRILRMLGRGGMGEVYEAEDLDMKSEHIALKTLRPSIADDARMIDRFKQEIQLSRRVSHRNVCRVFDLSRHPLEGPPEHATLFLTMELLSGETLAARLLRTGRMATVEALPLLEEMAVALDAAHAEGIVHRDFKPLNVMLAASSGKERVVVTDFGLARRSVPEGETTVTSSGVLMGTLDYMAPELLTGGVATPASDIYALGTVAYKMLTGVLPFAGDTPLASAILRAKSPAPSPRTHVPELDARWESAILRVLDPDPSHRFRSAGDFVRAIQGDTASVTVKIPVMTRRRWAGAAAAVVLLAGGWTVERMWSDSRNAPPPDAMRWYQAGAAALRDGTYLRAARALERAVSIDSHFTLAAARLAEARNELDDSEKAKEEMLGVLAMKTLHGTDALHVDAIRRTLAGDYPGAIQDYTQLAARVPDAGKSAVLVDLGRARERNDEPGKALEAYREAIHLDSQSAAAHLRLGMLLGRQRRMEDAFAELSKADSLYEALSNTEGRVEVLFQRGFIASTVPKSLADARTSLERAIQLGRDVSTEYQVLAATLQLSVVTYLEGDAAKAEEIAAEATEKARSGGMANLAARGLTDLGIAKLRRGDIAGTEGRYREALDLARRFKLHRAEARTQLQLADLHQRQNRPDEAVEEAESALKYYRAAGFRQESLLCLALIARVRRDRGLDAESLNGFTELLSLAKDAGDTPQAAIAEQGIASVLQQAGRWPEALEHSGNYYAIESSLHDRDGMVRALIGKSSVLWRLGRIEDALRALAETKSLLTAASASGILPLLISDQEASIDLSTGANRKAAVKAAAILQVSSVSPSLRASNLCVLGLAKARSGAAKEGRSSCAEGLKLADPLTERATVQDLHLAMGEIVIFLRDPVAVLLLKSTAAECERLSWDEPAWRAFALLSRAARQAGDSAAASSAVSSAASHLAKLRGKWNEADYSRYLARKDIAPTYQELQGKKQ